MKFARFRVPDTGNSYYGLVKKDKIYLIRHDVYKKPTAAQKGQYFSLDDIELLPPTIPSKIVLVGLNYRDHAAELKLAPPRKPVIFLKPPTSVIGPGQDIILPQEAKRVDYEAELAMIIRKEARSIKPEEAREHILGYTCLNDVTARDLQSEDGQWTRSKSFDTFCPVGPFIETNLEPSSLGIRLFLNDELKQSSNTSDFIFPIEKIVSFISGIMTLLPGDIISTGTPAGIGSMKSGDTVRVEIEKIGSLTNNVRK